MKLAIFSDVHANMPAMEAVFESIDAHGPDQIYCLGDLVGYAPWPNEVVDAVRRRNISTIAGNYDEAAGLDIDDCGCAYRSEEERRRGEASIRYTNDEIGDAQRRWLRGLPRHLRLEFGADADVSVLMVHGSPRHINEYLYEDRRESSIRRILDQYDADVMLCGHTHKPYHRVIVDEDDGEARYRHVVNTGSVGKPKDGDRRACWVLIEIDDEPSVGDEGAVSAEFVRVSYDVDAAATAIEASPLPDAFGEMLRVGGTVD